MFQGIASESNNAMVTQEELFQLEQIRAFELEMKRKLPIGALMQAAGKAAVDLILDLLGSKTGNVLILVGAGDNGGDAFEVAAELASKEFIVDIIMMGQVENYSAEAQMSLHKVKNFDQSKIRWISLARFEQSDLHNWAIIVDGLFGIGLNRPIDGKVAALINSINLKNTPPLVPVLALDVPSGLNADTGQLFGDHSPAIRASHTISFIANKPGLYTGKGKDYAGQVHLANLGLRLDVPCVPSAILLTPSMMRNYLPTRLQDSHKGSFGEVLVIGGAEGMQGAAILSGRSALFGGAGKIFIGFCGAVPLFDSLHPELMCRDAERIPESVSVQVVGPGLGKSEKALRLIERSLTDCKKLVIDADGLNLIADSTSLQAYLRDRQTNHLDTIITPHPLEAARLLNTTAATIQSNRMQAAQALAEQFNATVILKGAGTVIADSKKLWINNTGNPALSTAGTGDVLAGLCGALLAQGLSSSQAACLAVFTHGLAADTYVEEGMGPIGLCASELPTQIRQILNQLQR
ncbi:NAD(P)H-hydrate dehydratase [Undibacterium fentianense]|uniref:Bifunctional NAD(P)H-hydrate repair enzyme n=1 Tax=Undibacterium fentianense TaxID=2828728 RepID=A0A941E547_9BURK|nr:NAD(P)H-hydrate dehydratase [Undibacterium fentianense]MBR7798953.1 NAD(P)H-hydrate dehydratase [Undibacterium fentianense]